MPWTTLGESVAGTSHHARSVPCQDAFRFRTLGDQAEWLVVAVADGAGSAAQSEIGATLACDEFVRRVEAIGPEKFSSLAEVTALFADVRQALVGEAERLGIRPRELACTALLAIVGPESAVLAQVGDGVIVLRCGEDYRVVFWPEPSEYVNTTDFLTDEAFRDRLQVELVAESIVELAALTDGLQRLALDFAARKSFAGFFEPLFRGLRTADSTETLSEPFRGFLNSDRVNQRTDDDKTLVLACRRP